MTTYAYPVVLNDSDTARLNTAVEFFMRNYQFSDEQHREIWLESFEVIFKKIHEKPQMMSTYIP